MSMSVLPKLAAHPKANFLSSLKENKHSHKVSECPRKV